ncbi:undecaprenyl-diphosphate phosphatase [Synechococcus bigranulatus str. 'Rupite']|uniref:Undecaprenyl-diphosphatase n=1 Tax=Thermostichus vulcanus str. 'Rupite' TaxID=2813851 RepID=A0ABT0C7G0_THEVL|nr:undecaprenyl-diphosphate phosphatase [Thermostichus vulcanus str. 'Rupite']
MLLADIWYPNWWQALILGMVQGLTEFIPISSTAHLRVFPALVGWPDAGASFTAVIQLGSLLAVLIYFASDLRQLLLASWNAWQKRDFHQEAWRLLVGILVGTLPIVVVGLAIKVIWGSPPRQLWVIAAAAIGLALLLGWAEQTGKRERDVHSLGIWDGIWVGLAQTLALIPGVSRSGATITAGLFLNLQRSVAARYSFLLGIPALFLAGGLEFISDFEVEALLSQAVGTVSAFVFSYLSIDWLLQFLQRSSTWLFIFYRIGFGLFIVLGLTLGFLRP